MRNGEIVRKSERNNLKTIAASDSDQEEAANIVRDSKSEEKLKDIVVEEFRRVCYARGLFEMTNRA